ncbi:MAG: aldehyde dehydrogenase family protein, partial [Clostridia bacterium]
MTDFTALVASQREYFLTQATKPYAFRAAQLTALKGWIEKNEQAILDALNADLGKSAFEGYLTEVAMVKQELADALKHLRRWMKPLRARTALGQLPGKCRVYREPYGVTLIMSPWNYPFQLTLAPLIGALSAGNCAVVARMASELFAPAYVAVVEGGRAENAALLEEKFDNIFFTGSPAVGRLVMEKAARWLTPVSLELGGKSPVIVDESADIALAARRIVWGKLLNAGQTCVAP